MIPFLSKKFHRKSKENFQEAVFIPLDTKQWPQEWKTVHFKEYPRFKRFPLDLKEHANKGLQQALQTRKSSRSFKSGGALSYQDFSSLLYYSAGLKSEYGRGKTKRFYPSGGGLYAIELYAAVKKVENVEKGVYHFNVKENLLEKIGESGSVKNIAASSPYSFVKEADVILIFTIIWDRLAQKYHDLTYRLALIETGHISENILLNAAALNLKSCPLMGFDETVIEKELDIEADHEAILYINVIGR